MTEENKTSLKNIIERYLITRLPILITNEELFKETIETLTVLFPRPQLENLILTIENTNIQDIIRKYILAANYERHHLEDTIISQHIEQNIIPRQRNITSSGSENLQPSQPNGHRVLIKYTLI
jgi:hypothetical protein